MSKQFKFVIVTTQTLLFLGNFIFWIWFTDIIVRETLVIPIRKGVSFLRKMEKLNPCFHYTIEYKHRYKVTNSLHSRETA